VTTQIPETFAPATGAPNRIVSGFRMMLEGVQTYFKANQWAEIVEGGWKAREQILNQGPGGAGRVVFVHGRVPAANAGPYDAGAIEQPRIAGPRGSVAGGTYVDNPRPLRQWARIVTVSVWGVNAQALDDDVAQSEAAEELFERTLQAIHNAVFVDPDNGAQTPSGLADVKWEGLIWNVVSPNYGYGRELLGYLTHRGPIFDQAIGLAYPGVGPVKPVSFQKNLALVP
jgi:hypothetical protein